MIALYGRACAVMTAMSLLMCSACTFEPPAYKAPEPDQGRRPDLSVATDMTRPDQGRPDMKTLDQGRPDQGAPDMRDAGMDLGRDMAEMTVDSPPDMTPMTLMCGGAQVDVRVDPAHCGQCDNACDPKFGRCEQGRCGCEGGMTACGPERACRDTRIDPNHCGQCDFKCGAGAACNQGRCQCRPGFTLCNGECVDTRVDAAHCGQCNNSCQGKACRNSSCRGGDGCDFGDGVCRRDEGVACLKPDGFQNDLYCRNGADYGCGDKCGGDERCIKLDLFDVRSCKRYRPARGCSSCPCEDCSDQERCREETIGNARRAYCIKD